MRKKLVFLPALILVAAVAAAYAQNYSVSKLKIFDSNDLLIGHVIGFLGASADTPLIAVKPTPDDVVLIKVDANTHTFRPVREVNVFYFEFENCSGTPYTFRDTAYSYHRSAGFRGQTLYLQQKEADAETIHVESQCYPPCWDDRCNNSPSGDERNLVPAINTGMDFSVFEPPYKMK